MPAARLGPRAGLQAADDLVQDVLADLVRTLPNFAPDPRRRFRAWLRGVFDHTGRRAG